MIDSFEVEVKNLYMLHYFPLSFSPILLVILDNHVQLEKFCHQLDDKQNEIRILQRKLDRQRRANNPQNYTEKGTLVMKRHHKDSTNS